MSMIFNHIISLPGSNSSSGGTSHSGWERSFVKHESDFELHYSDSEDGEKIPSGQAVVIEQVDTSDDEGICLTQRDEPTLNDLKELMPSIEVDSDSEEKNAVVNLLNEFGNHSLANVIANMSAIDSPETPVLSVISQSEDSFREKPHEPDESEWGDLDLDEEAMRQADEAATLAMSFVNPMEVEPQTMDSVDETTKLAVENQSLSSAARDDEWGEEMEFGDLDEASRLALSSQPENASSNSQQDSILNVEEIMDYIESTKAASVKPREVEAMDEEQSAQMIGIKPPTQVTKAKGRMVDASTQVDTLDLPALLFWPKTKPKRRYEKLRLKKVNGILHIRCKQTLITIIRQLLAGQTFESVYS